MAFEDLVFWKCFDTHCWRSVFMCTRMFCLFPFFQKHQFILMYEERTVDVACYVCKILDQMPTTPSSPMYVDWSCCYIKTQVQVLRESKMYRIFTPYCSVLTLTQTPCAILLVFFFHSVCILLSLIKCIHVIPDHSVSVCQRETSFCSFCGHIHEMWKWVTFYLLTMIGLHQKLISKLKSLLSSYWNDFYSLKLFQWLPII